MELGDLWWRWFLESGGTMRPHLVGGGRSVFGRKRHQVLGDLGAAYLIDVRNGGTGYVHPVLNLGYRYNPKKDDWHLQVCAGTWGLVSVNFGLKW